MNLALLLLAPALTVASGDPGVTDPLAAEIARWSTFVRETNSSDGNWKDLKQGLEPAMARVEAALKDERRLLALERLAATRMNLAAFAYVSSFPTDTVGDEAKLDTEWTRVGARLQRELAAQSRSTLEGVQPAAVRAEAEAALPQARNYYDTSLEYGRATGAWSGFFYLGVAQAQLDFVSFCRSFSTPTELHAPKVRSIAAELDALEADLLRAYRPPASIERHAEFISASAALKEARELDAAGLRYGALLRYLQAAMRIDPLRPVAKPPDPAELPKRLEAFESRLNHGDVDHSIGRLYLETAQANLKAGGPPGANPAYAEAIARDVLPRYFAAIAPAKPSPSKPAPVVTVTLVRWPYT